MGRTRTLLGLSVLLGIAACQPIYGSQPARMRNPHPIKPPRNLPAEVVTVTYAEDCELITKRGAPVRRNTPRAEVHVRTGEAQLGAADRATDPASKGALLTEGIEALVRALEQDPFSADATLKLALAYDTVLRKGCALALLDRLGKLAQHPTFAEEANRGIDDVHAHKAWFERYRQDAIAALRGIER